MEEKRQPVALEQHITTSVVTISHAFSPGVDTKLLRAHIEIPRQYDRHADTYRCFPVHDTAAWAFQRIRPGGTDRTGRRGNQLIHTILVPLAVLHEAAFDTGLLMRQLPFRDHYTEGAGPVLDPLACTLDFQDDPAPVLHLQEVIGHEGVQCLLEQTLAALSSQPRRPLCLTPLPPERVSPLDQLRALLWLLPAGYRQHASFWVNATNLDSEEHHILLLAPSVRVPGHLRGRVLGFTVGSAEHASAMVSHPYPRVVSQALQAQTLEPVRRLHHFLSTVLALPAHAEALAAAQQYWEQCQTGFPQVDRYVEAAAKFRPWTMQSARPFLEGELRTFFRVTPITPPLAPWMRLFGLWSDVFGALVQARAVCVQYRPQAEPLGEAVLTAAPAVESAAAAFPEYARHAAALFQAVLLQAPRELPAVVATLACCDAAVVCHLLADFAEHKTGLWLLVDDALPTDEWGAPEWHATTEALMALTRIVGEASRRDTTNPGQVSTLRKAFLQLVQALALGRAPTTEAVCTHLTAAALTLLKSFGQDAFGVRLQEVLTHYYGSATQHGAARAARDPLAAYQYAASPAALGPPQATAGPFTYYTALLAQDPRWWEREAYPEQTRILSLPDRPLREFLRALWLECLRRQQSAGATERLVLALYAGRGRDVAVQETIFTCHLPHPALTAQQRFLHSLMAWGRTLGYSEPGYPEIRIQRELLALDEVAVRPVFLATHEKFPIIGPLEQFRSLQRLLLPAGKEAFYSGLLHLARGQRTEVTTAYAPLLWSYLIWDDADAAGDGVYQKLLEFVDRTVHSAWDFQQLEQAMGKPKVRLNPYTLSCLLIAAAQHRPTRLHHLFGLWLGVVLGGQDERLAKAVATYVKGQEYPSMPPQTVEAWREAVHRRLRPARQELFRFLFPVRR